MNTFSLSLRSGFKRSVLFLLGLWFLLFAMRFIYGFLKTDEPTFEGSVMSAPFELRQKNYAGYSLKKSGAKVATEAPAEPAPTQGSSDQKYERVSTLTNTSREFTDDEKKAYATVKQYGALIQYETKQGLPGYRQLWLGIGAVPDKFDALTEELRKIGKNNSLQIQKTDKTTEYRELNARKLALEKTRNSLLELKKNGGELSALIQLEEKILETENKIQETGVVLGNFDSENEFCTVKFTLDEGTSPGKISLFHRIKVALKWSVEVYAVLLGLSLLISAAGMMGLLFFKMVLKEIEKRTDKP